jgi:endonuclease-3
MARGKPEKTAAAGVAAKRVAPSRAAEVRVAAIFKRFAAAMPEPKTELEYVNDFTLLVAVILSAQATDAGVNKATRALFALAEKIKTIGLYRNKAKNIIALSNALLRDHGGEVPHTREALQALPGVGRKTANVVLNVAFGVETIAVDTHVFRVSNRIPLAEGRNPAEVEAGLDRIVPARFKRHAHHWLVLHGRYTCKARNPLCGACVIADLCRFAGKTV